ncbi:MAG: phospho-N-acetylmuramoyl-pentapeptide-transferase [Eubacteriales bacterium]
MREMASFCIAFFVTAVLGKILIPLLQRFKAGQSIKEDGPTWHMSKQGTPTMGGLMFIVGIGVAVFVMGIPEMLSGDYSHLFVFGFAFIFAVIGMIDDVQKIRHKANEGLTALQKLLLQLAVSLAFVVLLRYSGEITPNLYIPFLNEQIPMSWWLYMAFAAFVMVATVNSVNLTDGVDGLATGVTIPVMLFYLAVGLCGEHGTAHFTAAAFVGGLAAFLLYNYHPAKVFMGDTGSLFLGGAVCALAFVLNMPLVIPIIGLIYVLEALSDIIQVFYFKATKGKRFFRMAPLHHHFEMGGWSEKKLFCVFGGVTVILCVIAFLGVMHRYP